MTTPKVSKAKNIFEGLSRPQALAIVDVDSYLPYRAGDTIFEEGETAYGLFIIVKGQVEIYHGHGAVELTIAQLGPGEVFGEFGIIIESGQRTASARALSETELLAIPGDPGRLFREISDTQAAITLLQNLVCILGDRLRKASAVVMSSGKPPVVINDIHGEPNEAALNQLKSTLPQPGLIERFTPKKKLQPGQYLFRQGDPSDGFYLIDAGTVDVIDETPGREPRPLAHLPAPNVAGEIGFFSGHRRQASCRGAGPVDYTYFSGQIYHQLRERNPQGALEVIFAAAQLVVHLIVERQKILYGAN